MNFEALATSDSQSEPFSRSMQVIGLFPELNGVGGVQEAGRLTAAAITEIVRQRGGNAEFLSLNDASGRSEFEVDGHSISLHGFGRAKVRFTYAGLVRARRVRKDASGIVVAGHPHLAIPADLIHRLYPRLNVVVIAHGIEVWKALSPARRGALLRAKLVFAPSRFTADKLTEVQGVPQEKIRILPWPLNPWFLQMASQSTDLPLPVGFPRGRILLTVGRWEASERYKGVDELIHAVAKIKAEFPDVQLVAVGGGDDVPRLLDLAESLGVSRCVHFFSGLIRPQIAACYSQADVFALPSTGEGFGLVFLEAMAFAKPVVGAAFGGTMDLIEEGSNGILVPPRAPLNLASAIARLLRDDSLRARLGQTGADLVRNQYCFGSFKVRLQNILNECEVPLS
jgi:phosphatidylinositol alpha-1,6-mannosyltransferase